ncbi:cytidylate kinase [Candidatus Thorarchaeota archaeon]|jgi:cytidylate kinase|nr:MAG: cytidylate kinase [Candidatus Thorarchaeota archaeon]
MNRVITIGGLHGTGKSSVADRIADEFNLRRVSAGNIFRRLADERNMTLEEFSHYAEKNEDVDRLLDDTLRVEAEKGDAVLDGQLAGWMAGENADLKILLTAPLEVRVKRISERDGTSYEESRRETIVREGSEGARYQEYYGIDISDLSIYDIVLNTAKYDLDGVVLILTHAISTYFRQTEQ